MKRTLKRGKIWLMNKASRVAQPACSDGKAPKTIGEPLKLGVYKSMPKSLSIRANPAGDPWIE
jgi:hypothetical protein